MTVSKKNIEYPRLVAIETTNKCNATCPFCPNNALQRDRHHMSDDLFKKIVDDCTMFPLRAIEPFLNGEPFVDKKIISRLEYIREKLPDTRLTIYTNGYGLSPKKTDQLVGLGIDKIYVSLNTLNPEKYKEVMGLELEKTLKNMAYLTHPDRKNKIANKIIFRMTRTEDTSLEEQINFEKYCKKQGVKSFIVGLFNYKGEIPSNLPVPNYPCEHITRVDVLSNGIVTLCCMDEEGEYAWGDVSKDSILDIYNGESGTRYRTGHRLGNRKITLPCGECNVFWPSFEHIPLLPKAGFAIEAASYFFKYKPYGKRKPDR